jgi:hypothetical protein
MKQIISLLIRFVPRKYLQLFSHIPLKVYAAFMRGNDVECTVCENKFTKFSYGSIHDDWFGLNYHWHILVARKK